MTTTVYAIGDSVMQGAGPDLYNTLPTAIPGIEVDAAPSRQFHHAPDIVAARLRHAQPPNVFIIHLGTNGPLTDSEFDDLMSAAAPTSTVLIVNAHAPRDWIAAVNQRLTHGVQRHQQRAHLVDWTTTADANPDNVKNDGYHLSRQGAAVYANTISKRLYETTQP